MELVNQSVETRITELRESWEVALDTVKKIPNNEEELSNLKDYLRDVKKLVMDPNLNALRKDPDTAVAFQINLLNEFNFIELRKEAVEEAYDMLHWTYTVEEAVQFRKGEIEIEKQKFMEALDKEKKIYVENMKSWQKRIDVVRTEFTQFEEANKYAM